MARYRPGQAPRLFYRTLKHRGRRDEPMSFSWRDYRDLVVALHKRRGRPVVLVWDNLNRHLCVEMAAFIAANTLWLTMVQLPSYAPELNPVRGVVGAQGRTDRQPGLRRLPRRHRPDLGTIVITKS